MRYKIVPAQILNDGTVAEGERKLIISWASDLMVGGLYYFFAFGRIGETKLYRVVEKISQ